MTGYYLMTSSLYLISYPLSETLQEVPVKIAYTLMRILTSVIFIAIIHLY